MSSLDIDYFNMKLLKITKDYIDIPLSHICNLCLSSGTFPLKMKLSSIKPIIKKITSILYLTIDQYLL